MNYYIIKIDHQNRAGLYVTKSICFVMAETKEEAQDKAWAKCGSDSSSIGNSYEVEHFEESGICEFYTY